MAASINMRESKIAGSLLSATAGYITGAAGEYISDSMPNTTSVISGMKTVSSKVSSSITNADIMGKVTKFKSAASLRNVLKWYTDSDNSFGSDVSDDLVFDVDTDDAAIAEVQYDANRENADRISQAVIQSNQHLLEGQVSLSAQIATSIDKQTGVITTGFDTVNSKLDSLIKILTKNTAAMIEATVATNANGITESGKFNMDSYLKNIQKNIKSDPALGMAAAFLPMLTSPSTAKMMFSPDRLVSMAFSGLVNSKLPNLQNNLKALDNAVNSAIVNSLIRLGENKNNKLAKIFGINSTRKEVSGQRSSLELKDVSFTSMDHEAITNAIPGYLRKILYHLSGEDVIYDYRSRSFRSKNAIKRDFIKVGQDRGTLGSASKNVQNIFGNDAYGNMIYDIMMADLGTKQGLSGTRNRSISQARETIYGFQNKGEFEKYITKVLQDNGVILNAADRRRFQQIGRRMNQSDAWAGIDMSNQVARTNVKRNERLEEYVRNAERYNVDLQGLKSSTREDIKNILKENGMISSASVKSSERFSTGTDYTNKALYEIYRLLDRGINVFSVGSSSSRSNPYKRMKNLYVPRGYRTKNSGVDNDGYTARINAEAAFSGDNLLRNNEMKDGSTENLTRGERFKRWTGKRGGELGRAVLSGNPDDVATVFAGITGDVAGVAKDSMMRGIEKINTQFGNVSGYLKHKMFGTGYEYEEDGKTIKVKENKLGGIFGFVSRQVSGMFDSAKSSAGKWFDSVKGYFDYGDSKESGDVKSKRKRFLSASVGAMTGAGLLGGPLGLIMGGVAGSAIGSLDIGDKIKNMLFGRDEKGKPTGLLTKLGEKVIDPIKYQFAKTANYVGNALKKNILGPLSDIGFVIKERISNAAQSTFGKVFGFIGKMIMAPFKAIGNGLLNIASLPITLAGMGARGLFGLKTGVAGAGLNTAAGLLAFGDKETSTALRERRASRNADIKASSKFQSYKDWKVDEEGRKAARIADLQASMAEETEEVAKSTSHMDEKLSDLHYHATHTDGMHSIFTHDDGLHNKVERIIEIISKMGGGSGDVIDGTTGAKMTTADMIKQTMEESNILSNDNGMANAGISAAAIIAAEGNITSDDKKEVNAIMSESQKRNSSTSIIRNHLNRLLSSQEKEGEENKKKSDSLWDKIISGITGIVGGISKYLPQIAVIASAISFLKDFIGRFDIGKTTENLVEKLKAMMNELLFGDDEEEGDEVDEGANAIAALSGNHVESIFDMANPFATIYQNQKDANGKWIKDQETTSVKTRAQFTTPLLQESQMGNLNVLRGIYNKKYGSYLREKAGAKFDKYSSDAYYNSKKIDSSFELDQKGYDAIQRGDVQISEGRARVSHAGSSTVSGIANSAAKVGIIAAGGSLAGAATGAVAKGLGASDETAAKANSIGTRVGTAGLIAQHGISKIKGNTSLVDKILDGIKKLFDILATKLKADKALSKIGSKIDSFFDGIYNKTVGKLTTTLADKIGASMAAKLGFSTTEQLASVLTVGIVIAAAGAIGAVSGYCGTEYLFGVLPGQADSLMKTISSVLTAAFMAAEATPIVGYFVMAAEILDELLFKSILIDENGMGHGLKGYIAMWLYDTLAGKEGAASLKDKQAALLTETNYYNQTYGTNIDINAYNDLVNRNGIMSTIMHGKTQYDSQGHVRFDASGKLVDGGLSGFAQNGETLYAYNENGAVIRRADGSAVEARDANGNIITKTKSGEVTTNSLRNTWNGAWSGLKGFFTGKDTYETDENGRALVNADGTYKVKEHKDGLIDKFKRMTGIGQSSISESADSTIDQIKKEEAKTTSNKSKLDAASTKLTELTSKGKYDEIMKYKLTLDTNDPMNGVFNASFLLTKRMAASTALLNNTGDTLSNIANTGTAKTTSNTKTTSFFARTFGMGGPMSSLFSPTASFANVTDTGVSSGLTTNSKTGRDGTTISGAGRSFKPADMQNPFNDKFAITSGFGERSAPRAGFHEGIDMVPSDGSLTANIKSTIAGTIESVKNDVSNSLHAYKTSSGYAFNGTKDDEMGNNVVIKGDNGLTVRLMHLKQGSIPSSIKPGKKVSEYTKIGEMGNTGWSTGPHLHYQMADSKGRIFDPTPYVKGASANVMNYSYAPTTADTYADSTDTTITEDTSTISDTTTTVSENLGPIGTLLSKLSSFGANLLFKITGGLYGASSDSSSDSSLSATGVSDQVAKVLNIARAEVGFKGQVDNINKYNDWFYGKSGVAQPWCMAFVQWCYNQAGYPMDYKSAGCLDVWNHYNAAGKTHTDNPRPGDIWIRSRNGGGHTGIVDSVDGNTFYTIEGNTGDDEVAKRTHTVGEAGTYGFITLLSQEVSSTASILSSGATGSSTDIASLWKYFRAKGWSDKAIAGALGCWTAESSVSPNRIEGDYTAMYKAMSSNPYVDLINDRDLMDKYARDYLLPNYRKNGKNHKDANYKGKDGHYYVGLGMAQWTAQRGKNLLDFAKRNNLPWDTRETQLKFMDEELRGDYKGVLSAMEKASGVEAATKVFMNKYEGNSDSTGYLTERAPHAIALYNKYAGSAGGPTINTKRSMRDLEVLRDPNTGEILEVQNPVSLKGDRAGGPTIGANIYKPKIYRQTSKSSRAGGVTTTAPSITSSNSVASYVSPTSSPIVTTTTSSGQDLSGVVSLLTRTVEELVKITNNTASSSTLLGSINDKDFVDQGLRDSIAALKNVKTSQNSTIPKPTASSVTAMARP